MQMLAETEDPAEFNKIWNELFFPKKR
jgi:hypothetical protein